MSKRAGSAPKAAKPKAPANTRKRGSSVPAERGLHTPEGAGSRPAPATKQPGRQQRSKPAEGPKGAKDAGGTKRAAGLAHTSAPSDKLNARQRAFVVEYLKDKNATQAYMRVYGVSQATAERAGPRLMGNVVVRTEVDRIEAEQLAQVQAETGITLQRTLEYIARGAFYDPRKFFEPNGELVPVTDLDDVSAAALAGFEVTEIAGQGKNAVTRFVSKAKLADRRGYLDMLMKHLGGYKKDNEQSQTPLAEAMRDFIGSLHQAGSRLPIAPRS